MTYIAYLINNLVDLVFFLINFFFSILSFNIESIKN